MAYSRHEPLRAKSTTGAVRSAATYYTYRTGPDHDAGGRSWATGDGRMGLSLDDVRSELREHASASRQVYIFVLSTKAVALAVDDYRATLDGHYDHYYLIEHHNTDHPHCHGIGFREKQFKKAELRTMYDQLGERERSAEQARDRQLERTVERDVTDQTDRRRSAEQQIHHAAEQERGLER
ncbi:MAG: hypothetical protein H0X37_22135 [Herpetosiphonaceae bacterium]|nr:hypothetical protein [Herpetosiphonaceae bacterium]